MCKFQKPQIPADATVDEKRAIMFDALSQLDLSDKVERREELTYLSWANAWAEFKYAYPSATYRIVKDPTTGLPYFADPLTGIIVYTEVTVDDVTHEMWLPVMDNKNKAMKFEPYTYTVTYNGKTYEVTMYGHYNSCILSGYYRKWGNDETCYTCDYSLIQKKTDKYESELKQMNAGQALLNLIKYFK